MVKIRKFSAYQNLERPYTRISKFTNKNFVRGGFPHMKITKFEVGDSHKKFDHIITLNVTRSMNIRQNSLEAARMTCSRLLEKKAGKDFYFKMRVYPFHVLRENPLAAGAGADRMSQGMSQAYGKPVGSAARMREGQIVFELRIDKAHLTMGKEALGRASKKLPCTCKVMVQ